MAPDTLERAAPALKDSTLLRQQCYVNGEWSAPTMARRSR